MKIRITIFMEGDNQTFSDVKEFDFKGKLLETFVDERDTEVNPEKVTKIRIHKREDDTNPWVE